MVRLPALLVVFSMLLSPVMVAAQDATPSAADGRYRDPDGRFSVPVPTNWTVDERDGVVTLVDPDEDLRIVLLVVTALDAKSGIEAGWNLVDPSFDTEAPPVGEQDVPSGPGIDETYVITYDGGEQSGQLAQGLGQRIGDQVYLLLITGSLDAAIKRNSQVQVIATGYVIEGVELVDLSKVKAKTLSGDVLDEFVAYVEELRVNLEIPGASVAVVQDGRVVYTGGFGVKELGGEEPVTAETLMMIGSTTKSMTTMMMGSEVDDGLMTWDQPVVEVLPEFAVADPELSETITMRNLVCACTGVPRRDLEFIFNANELSAEDVIASLQEFEFFTGFGEAFQYSNQMVATGGYAAAAAAGGDWGDLAAAYDDEIRERVLDPIGMTETTFSFNEVIENGDYATPHGANLTPAYEPIPLSLEETLIPIAPAGLAWSNVTDMAKYLQTQLALGIAPDGTRVISEENLLETWEPQVAVDATTGYGLGWFVGEYKGLREVSHGGNTFGFTSDLAFLPDEGIGIVVLANGQGTNLFNEGVRIRLWELLFGQPMEHDAEIERAVKDASGTVEEIIAGLDAVPARVAAEVEGTYTSETLGQVEVRVEAGELVLDAGEFTTKLVIASNATTADSATLVAFEAPFAGTPLVFRGMQVGERTIEIDLGTDQYVFDYRDDGATPVASPVAEQRRRAA